MYTTQTQKPTTTRSAQIITQALADRRERAQRERGGYHLTRQKSGAYFIVTPDRKRRYEATTTSCTCADFRHNGAWLKNCKHTIMVQAAEGERLAEGSRERAARNINNDFPTDSYDQRDPFGPLPDPTPEMKWWEDGRQAAEYAEWLSQVADEGSVFPCD